MYRLFHIDLDESNQFEQSEEEWANKKTNQYQFNAVLEYQDEDVDSQPLKQIHVRGSSKKNDNFDMNEKL